jgi:hypothetical protein
MLCAWLVDCTMAQRRLSLVREVSCHYDDRSNDHFVFLLFSIFMTNQGAKENILAKTSCWVLLVGMEYSK